MQIKELFIIVVFFFVIPLGFISCDGEGDRSDTEVGHDAGSDILEECEDYRTQYPSGPYGPGVDEVVGDWSGMVDGENNPHNLEELYSDPDIWVIVVVNAYNTCPTCNQEALMLEQFAAKYEHVAVINTLIKESSAGDAALAAHWSSIYNLTDVHVWADTKLEVYENYTGVPPISGAFPSVMVIDVDTMTLKYFEVAVTAMATEVVEELLNENHPCWTHAKTNEEN